MLFMEKLIPVAAEPLKLGVFKNVAVREKQIGNDAEYYYTQNGSDEEVEVITYYNRTRKKGEKLTNQSLHIYFKGRPENLQVIAYTNDSSHVLQSTQICYLKNAVKIGEVNTSFMELPKILEEWILKAQKVFSIKINKQIQPYFDETVQLLSEAYGPRFYALDMMSTHISANNVSIAINCETGWGDDFYFTMTKDQKHIAMKVDLDKREVGEGERSTYRETKEIGAKGVVKTFEEFFLDCNFIKQTESMI